MKMSDCCVTSAKEQNKREQRRSKNETAYEQATLQEASRRSSFFRLSPIKRTLRACATITSCPNSLSSRLTHGECIPVSSAIRLRGIPPNPAFIAFGVVPSFCSSTTSPCSFNTQYQLERSPRSNPIVSFASEKFLICFRVTVLIFFIAGLLYLLRFKRVDNLGAYSIPSETGLLIPSDFVNNHPPPAI